MKSSRINDKLTNKLSVNRKLNKAKSDIIGSDKMRFVQTKSKVKNIDEDPKIKYSVEFKGNDKL